MQRLLVGALLALVFAPPAAAANIVLANTSSLPESEIVDALPAFQRALDEDFAPVWPEARGSKLLVDAAPAGSWEIRIVDVADCLFCDGYHSVVDGTPYAVVSAHDDDWHVTLTHELWEMVVNPYADRVAIVQPKQKTTARRVPDLSEERRLGRALRERRGEARRPRKSSALERSPRPTHASTR